MSKHMEIEDAICENLTGETQTNALDFVAFLRANDYAINWDGNWWCVEQNGNCPVLLGVNSLGVESGVKFGALFNYCDFDDSKVVDNELKEVTWAHVQVCAHFASGGKKCGCGNQPEPVAIFGKEFNACKSPLTFIEPSNQILSSMKKLLLLQR